MNNSITGKATYYLASNVDTDIIIPARFLKRTTLSNFQPFAFFERRYLPETICQPVLDAKDFVFQKKILNPEFPPNHPHCKNATFLLTWSNFGCGSSREHAVYSLSNYKVIIGSAPTGQAAFADIFRDNCRQNLIWTPVVSSEDHEKLKNYLQTKLAVAPATLTLDIENKVLRTQEETTKDNLIIPFSIPKSHLEFFANSEADPFTTAQKGISNDLKKIIAWEKEHASLLNTYPNSAIH